MSTTTTEVKVGQVWADNDYRSAGRTLRVEFVGTDAAVCEILTDRDPVDGFAPTRSTVGQRRTIALKRFRPTSTGYRLLEDVP